ncbi:hypothetical protein H0E87_019938 [Populus deltoides]|uniref:Uncharacterized protein n=1 Tax=Populus deltoides TaxID=3696 RepID=A0A8T2XX89_POPDE|nr:hypothetical protein H0E87_019938 [Populus deltoides]
MNDWHAGIKVEYYYSRQENVCSQCDLDSSVALVSTESMTIHSTLQPKKGLPAFTEGLVNQLAADLQRINRLGKCDEESKKNAKIHNQVLQKAVGKLNTDDGNKSTFVILDLYNAMVFLLWTNSDRMQQIPSTRTHCSHVARRMLSTYAQRKDCARIPSHLSFSIWHTLRTMAGMQFIHFCKVLLTMI